MYHDSPLVAEGHRIRNAFNGETFIFTHVREDASAFQFDVLLEPGGMQTGTGMHHVHPFASEAFTVKSGKLALSIQGECRILGAGENCVIAAGIPHFFRNGHAGETLFTARFTPGQQFLRFFLNMASGTADHPDWYDERGEPPLLLRALALHHYAGHGYAAAIPIWLQRALFASLTPFAYLAGYRLSVTQNRQ
ncbi:cupin domain-containing protein [Methylobacterium soli]|nr:cupin domain-containing protein [Methylobacterium soli]